MTAKETVEKLGGVLEVAHWLGLKTPSIDHWIKTNKIPPGWAGLIKVRLEHPEIFEGRPSELKGQKRANTGNGSV